MSRCIITSGEDTLMRKFETNEPYYAAKWMLGRLVPSELVDKLDLNVYIRKMKHQHGICWAYQNHPNMYDIVISSNMGRKESLRVLAHETVHVWQYITGKMRDLYGQSNRGKVLWKNKMLENSDSAYYNLPWEKEAFAMQEKLLDAYLAHVKKLIT